MEVSISGYRLIWPWIILVGVFTLLPSKVIADSDTPVLADFASNFEKVSQTADPIQIEKFLSDAEKTEGNNPEFYVAKANYHFSRVNKENITADSQRVEMAVQTISLAIEKFPHRLDLRTGAAYIHQELGFFDKQLEILKTSLDYAQTRRENLKWKEDAPLPLPYDQFFPKVLQGYCQFYYSRSSPEDGERFLQIAQLVVQYFPTHPYGYSAVGTYHCVKEDWNKSLEFFLKAQSFDKEDPLILINLGEIYMKLGNKDKAIPCFLKIINSEAPQQLRTIAIQKMKELSP